MKAIFRTTIPTLTLLTLFLVSAPIRTALSATSATDETVSGHNAFAIDLYQTLGQHKGNLFFSPLSISIALSMTYAGAKNQTATDMQKVMHFSSSETALHEGNQALQQLLEKSLVESSQLDLANALWPNRNETLLASFVQSMRQYYGADCQALDLVGDPEGSAAVINNWVKEKTHGRIVELLKPSDINPQAGLILTNAIVFDGEWEQAFDPEHTGPLSFNFPDGGTAEVLAMKQNNQFLQADLDGFSMLEMPFKGHDASFLILLPDEVNGLADLESKLTPAALAQWIAELRPKDLSLVLPRFAMDERVELAKALDHLGMGNAFSVNADFSGISETGGLYIGQVIHQATLKIHEEGAEAAAATALIMLARSCVEGEFFVVDRPFLFMIRNPATGSIFFMGRMMNPSASKQ